MKHPVKRVSSEDCEYEYRGIRFERTGISRRYWGHYAVLHGLGKTVLGACTRKDLLRQIDAHLDKI